MIKSSAMILVSLALSACASTGGTSPSPAGEPETVTTAAVSDSKSRGQVLPPDEGDMVCRFEKTVNSRIGRRVCRTETQEEAAKEAAQEALERFRKQTDEDLIVTGN
jgi:hypothetical protein